MLIQSVCVYCSSSNRLDPIYYDTAKAVGSLLAQNNLSLVYGGGDVGLTGAVSNATLKAGGKVVGVITEYLHTRERQHNGLTELFVVSDMHARKKMMFEKADAFVVLPGGFGTLDEFFEILTWKQLGTHAKPIVIVNVNHFWDPLLTLISHLIDSGFAPKDNYQTFTVIEKPEELLNALANDKGILFDPTEKWQ